MSVCATCGDVREVWTADRKWRCIPCPSCRRVVSVPDAETAFAVAAIEAEGLLCRIVRYASGNPETVKVLWEVSYPMSAGPTGSVRSAPTLAGAYAAFRQAFKREVTL